MLHIKHFTQYFTRPAFAAALLLVLLMSAFIAKNTAAAESDVYRLPNGLTVVLHQDKRFPLVSMRLYVHAGSAYEKPEEAGISHLLEHMVFKGTSKRPEGQVAEDIEKIGGYINAATSFDYTVYIADVPAKYWKTGLDVLQDMAFNPKLDHKALEAEKKVVIAELKRGKDNPASRLFDGLHATSLRGTPYEHPIIGYEEVINNITSHHIRDYISRHYQPQSMLLMVCGDFDKDDARKQVDKLYGTKKNTQALETLPSYNYADIKVGGPLVRIEKGPWNKVYLGLALPAPEQKDPASVHLDVLCSLLGDGKTSYFYRKYKYDLQLVDSISFSNYGFERAGMLYMTAVLDPENLQEFWSNFTQDLAGVSKIKFTQQELDRVKLNLEDSLYRAKETLAGQASKLGYFEFFYGGEAGERAYLYNLEKTSLEDIQGQLSKIMDLSRLSVEVLMPQSAGTVFSVEEMQKMLGVIPSSDAKAVQSGMKGTAKTEVIDLGKGRKIILLPDKTMPYISVSFMFTGGDSLLKEDEQGLAGITAALMTKGTNKYSANSYEDYLEDHAAAISASSGRQTFSFNLSTPARFSNKILPLLTQTMNSPAFKSEELERVKNSQISAIKASEDQPVGLAFRRLFPFLFKKHPYGYFLLGTPESVSKVKRQDVKDFWSKQKQQPWVLAVCGDFTREDILDWAKQLPEPTAATVALSEPVWGEQKLLELTLAERTQAHLFMVFQTVPIADKDAPAIDLLQSVLSGQSGLLFSELRDRQSLGYTVTAIPWNTQKTGALIFYIGTEPGKMEQARQGFLDIVTQVRTEKLPASLLERGKNSIEGDYYRNNQSLGARSSEAATLTILGLPLDTNIRQIEAASKVTPEELRKVAQKYLDADKAYWMTVTP